MSAASCSRLFCSSYWLLTIRQRWRWSALSAPLSPAVLVKDKGMCRASAQRCCLQQHARRALPARPTTMPDLLAAPATPAPCPADRDNFLSPQQAVQLGLIDDVIE